jgi:hypothetical protein
MSGEVIGVVEIAEARITERVLFAECHPKQSCRSRPPFRHELVELCLVFGKAQLVEE